MAEKELNIPRGVDTDDLGVAVSVALTWNGSAIFQTMIAALTDANFHTAAKALTETWNKLEG
jgi:hypothetical protein